MRSLIALLDEKAGSAPDRPLYVFRNALGTVTSQCTFGEFHRNTDGLAHALRDTGLVRPSEPVLLAYQPGPDFAAAFYACAKIGSIPVPVPPPGRSRAGGDTQRIEHIARDSGAKAILHEDSLADRLTGLTAPDSAAGPLSLIETTALETRTDHFAATPGDILFLQYTSGSTENPRGVMVTHENVIHNSGLILDTSPDRIPVGVSWLPHYHDMGLVGFYLFAVTSGGTSHIISPLDFLKRPHNWLRIISDVRASITSAPNFALKYCLRDDKVAPEDLAGIDLSSLDCLMNGAEPIQHETVDRFVRKFEPWGLKRSAVVAGYGLAEHTLCVTNGSPRPLEVDMRALESDRPGVVRSSQAHRHRHTVVSCGRPPQGVSVKLVDPESSTEVPEDRIGEIWVSSPSMARGYWNRPDLTEKTFRARISGSGDNTDYLRTGDMGFLHDGELFVCGRRKDMIVIRGQNVYPTDIEALIERSFRDISPGSVAAFGVGGNNGDEEGLVVILESPRGEGEALLHAIQREVRKSAGVSADTLAIVPKGTIQHTSSGKIVRHDCRERWIGGRIDVVASVSSGDDDNGAVRYERVIEEILDRLADLDDHRLPLEAAGLDSLDLVTLNLYLEDKISEMPPGARGKNHSFSDLAVLQAMTVGELIDLNRSFRSASPDWAVFRDIVDRLAKTVAEEERSAMREDSVLPDWNGAAARQQAENGRAVFITGATGFLGSYLLRSLLHLTERPVIVLARCPDAASGRERLVQALASTGLDPATAQNRIDTRVTVLPGDLSRQHLGLETSEWERLAGQVGNIYHCAAEVDYVKPYRSLKPANVSGTRTLLELAASGNGATFHFISTTFIFGWSILDRLKETARNRTMKGIDFGYAQTKWVSEQLVHEAIRRGQRAKIYRPSLVTASRNAHFVARDITARVLGYMIRHGISVDLENQLSFVPVDICANNIVAISLLDNVKLDTFHITESTHYALDSVCSAITRNYGYSFETVSPDGFLDHVNAHCHEDDDLFPLRGFVSHNLHKLEHMKRKRYDNSNYRRACSLSATAIKHPPLERTVGAIVDFLRHERLV